MVSPKGLPTTDLIQRELDRLRGKTKVSQRAIDRLVTHAYQRLEKLAHQMLRTFPRLREDTGDLLAPAYLRLARALDDPSVRARLVSPRDFLRFAAAQMRRELIDLSRRYARRREQTGLGGDDSQRSTSTPLTVPADPALSPQNLAAWTEFHERVERLPADEQEAFGHVWYHDLTFVEAAQILQVDERTVRRRYQAARDKLREHFGSRLSF